MNSIQLRKRLIEMMSNYMESLPDGRNPYPCYYVAVIDCIMKMYMEKPEYMEENAIKTFSEFLKHGVLVW